MIHDNILVAHELVHYLQSTKNGPNKGFVIKLDMSKAYDQVEWQFIEEVLSAKYFPDGDVFSYKKCDKPSSTWSSIAKAIDVLKDRFIWPVGKGNKIDLRRDHWGVEGITGELVCRSPFKNNERKLKDLWDHGNRQWKRERVIEIYGDNLGDCICNFPIPHNGIKDTRTWIQNCTASIRPNQLILG
ncbi:hypothetical protein PVK06_039967 [Gossypium arboreum]|uniref:Reverse transcriptase n=1 Tax=Gossypium arboreum TaxID=29729 RepID=A0ABR0N6C3_GOSAR|nr:hypothetical protein PVK06_039967 [Gossypium arboreum]